MFATSKIHCEDHTRRILCNYKILIYEFQYIILFTNTWTTQILDEIIFSRS